MFAQERQRKILELLRENGTVSTAQLTERFGISIETVRRDLLAMEQEGLLRRVHGGAIATEEMALYNSLEERKQQNNAQKRDLCRLAAGFVRDGDVIGVGSGSTAIHFAAALRERQLKNLTIITYSLDVVEMLRYQAGWTLLCCGGIYDPEENIFCGPLALDTMEQLHMKKSFVFPSAISLRQGIHDHPTEAFAFQKRFLQCADEVFVAADSSKFERRELLKLDDMRPIYTYITDDGLHPAVRAMYKEHGLRVVIAGEGNEA